MRVETRTHLSVVNRVARVARVTVGACGTEERKSLRGVPDYRLNDRVPPRLSPEDLDYIQAAREAAEKCWLAQPRRDEVPVVLKIDMPIVDMHIEAVRAAAIEATQALFPDK